MQYETTGEKMGIGARLVTLALRIIFPVAILAIAFLVMYLGFNFLRAGDAPKALVAVVAIVWARLPQDEVAHPLRD